MRITKVNIPKEKINNGLEGVRMQKLGQFVLLAGKNGAGKSRLLSLVANTFRSKPVKTTIEEAKRSIDNLSPTVERAKLRVKELEDLISSEPQHPNIQNLREEIYSSKSIIDMYSGDIKENEKLLDWDLIETDELRDSYSVVPFVPKSLELYDCNKYNKAEIKAHAKNIDQVGINTLAQGTFARIQVIQDKWFSATHQHLDLPPEEKDAAIADYTKLQELISHFLNTKIERNIDNDPMLFGFPLGQANLSDGQKILLQLCLAVHCQAGSLDQLILFLDEPENHLHPSVIIQTIERIVDKIPNGQIWISTHSIPLLSYFDPANIWYVENNSVSYAGQGPEKVLRSLLGDEEHISKLQDFISLPGILALNRHAFESLFHPEAVLTDSKDPQTLQINEEIRKQLKNESKIRVLDYGAGKGRLLANIIEASQETVTSFSNRFDYVAFDKFPLDEKACLATISKVYEDPVKRYYSSLQSLFADHDKESFDVVVMSNVLHEIDPKEWLKLFGEGGEIPRLLTENGILLLVEDQEMPIGEKAYQKGFIVLNTAELKELFNIKTSDEGFTRSAVREGRLTAHIIPRAYLTRITPDSRIKALKSVNQNAQNNILTIREDKISYKNGKKHGFWIQQFANTALALSELDGKG